MSTRSIIAVGNDLSWKGRYAHCDGYPSWMATALWTLIERDGVQRAVQMLTQIVTSWSSVQPTMTQTLADDTYSYRDEIPFVVEGYGIPHGFRGGSEDVWINSTDTDKWGTEWLYIIGDQALIIEKVHMDGTTSFVAEFFYDEDPDFVALQESGRFDQLIKQHSRKTVKPT